MILFYKLFVSTCKACYSAEDIFLMLGMRAGIEIELRFDVWFTKLDMLADLEGMFKS